MAAQSNGQDIDLLPMDGNEPFSQPVALTDKPTSKGITLPRISLQQVYCVLLESIVDTNHIIV